MKRIFKNEGAIQNKVWEFRFNGQNRPEHALYDILRGRGLKTVEAPEYVSAVTRDVAGNKSAYFARAHDHELEDGFHVLTMDGKIEWPFYFLPGDEVLKGFTNIYVCYWDVITDLFWIFNLADFHINEIDNYEATGTAFRAVYQRDRRTDKWKLIITA